jgi:hypothetical protein
MEKTGTVFPTSIKDKHQGKRSISLPLDTEFVRRTNKKSSGKGFPNSTTQDKLQYKVSYEVFLWIYKGKYFFVFY